LNEVEAVIDFRFPLLQSLLLSDGPQAPDGRLPAVVGLIAMILESAERPCCIVMPDHANVALAVSILLATKRLQGDLPEILRSHAALTFKEGDRVLVHPFGLVYEYGGFFTPEHFRLRVLGRRERRSLSVHQVARLERTTRKMPKGYGSSDLGKPQPTVLGTLVGIPGVVNRNLLRNYVLVLGSKKRLLEQLTSWRVGVAGSAKLTGIAESELPFGEISDDGSLQFFDNYVAAGQPLVGITSRSEDLAFCCRNRQPQTAAVIVDDAERLARNLQSYDAIADCQRMVVLARESQTESVSLLKDRGCDVWQLSPDEILLGVGENAPPPLWRGFVAKASNMRGLAVSPLACTAVMLDEAAADLCGAAKAIPPDNENPTVRDLLLGLFGLLSLCAEYLGSDVADLNAEAEKRFTQVERSLPGAQIWLSPEVAKLAGLALEKLRLAADDLAKQSLTAKGEMLLHELASGSPDRPAAVIVRSDSRRADVLSWFARLGRSVTVFRIADVSGDRQFGEVVLISWPGARRFERLLRLYITGEIKVLAYTFERLWVSEYGQRCKRSSRPALSTKRKCSILGLTDQAIADEEPPSAAPVPFDLPEERFFVRRKSVAASLTNEPEESVEAHYVDFVGPTFAHITEGHELIVVNDFIAASETTGRGVRYRTIEDLETGDFVMFRESGDSDIIRFMVEDRIGKNKYQQLRETAGRWQKTIKRLGSDPRVVWIQLRGRGFTKHLTTVRAWLTKSQMIGPKDSHDLDLIASAAQDEDLLAVLPEVKSAIDEIKGLHVRAGFQLTDRLVEELGRSTKQVELFGSGETELDLGFGKVWVVRVEHIDEAATQCSRSLVNRLLWDEDGTPVRSTATHNAALPLMEVLPHVT
jgi:hypothetical protein